MKNTKQFFTVFLSVIVCVLAISAITYATTISTNVSTVNVTATGTLTVTGASTLTGTVALNGAAAETELAVRGTASLSQDLWASGSFQFGAGEGTGTVSYSRLGAGTTGHSLSDSDDLLITGLLEVDDVAYFDSNVSMSDSATLTVTTILGNADEGNYVIIGDASTTGHSLNANDDLLVTGDLEIDGTAFFDGNVSMSDSATLKVATLYGHTDAAEYLRVGDQALTSHSLNAQDDILVTGDMEVDGTAWFDGTVSLSSNGLILDGGASITTGATSPSAACVIGSLYIDTVLGTISMCDASGDWSPITVQ